MKNKILAQLKAKFSGVQSNLLDRVADELAKTVTKDEDIDAAVTGAAGLVNMFASFHQSESDRRVTEAVTKVAAEKDAELKKFKEGKEPKEPKDPKDEIPAWAQAMLDANKALTDKIAQIETGNLHKTLTDKVLSKFKELEIDEDYYTPALSGRTFKDDTEVESFITSTETAFKTYKQKLVEQGLGQTKPITGVPDPKTGVSAGVKSYLEEKTAEKKDAGLGGKQL